MILRGSAKNSWKQAVSAALVLVFATAATVASAQVKGLYYREEVKDGRIYVFNTYEKYQQWKSSGEMGVSITLIGRGPDGETVIAENDVAVDLYLFKHNLPGYDRPSPPAPAPPAAFPKTTIGGRPT